MKADVIIGRVVISHYNEEGTTASKSTPTPVVQGFIASVCTLFKLPFPAIRFVKSSDVVSSDELDVIWEVYEFHLPNEDKDSKWAYKRVLGGVADYLLSQSLFLDCIYQTYPYKVPF
ncbi:MAG: hypothetical protein F9K23_00875 [Bacteroidetes bacterium]|nr:MAG: hypothetical protein F9K23_00875 [Bacteroidota bacterium]